MCKLKPRPRRLCDLASVATRLSQILISFLSPVSHILPFKYCKKLRKTTLDGLEHIWVETYSSGGGSESHHIR